MRIPFVLPMLLATLLSGAVEVRGGDWLTIPAPYTHAPGTGVRTHQYQTPEPSPAPAESLVHTGGYRHYRSSLQVGRSADHYHRTQRWGDSVRPYGEWRYPYRPYSAPYPAWGPPFGGVNQFFGNPGYGAYGNPMGRHGHGGATPRHGGPGTNFGYPVPYPALPDAGYAVPPYYDGSYPSLPFRPRLNDEQFYAKPDHD